VKISVSAAKGKLTELVRRAEIGEDVELTRHGRTVARIIQAPRLRLTPEEKRAILEKAMEEGRKRALPGPCAARAADFLYDDETGLPA
jgi:prevent-host-death family protein